MKLRPHGSSADFGQDANEIANPLQVAAGMRSAGFTKQLGPARKLKLARNANENASEHAFWQALLGNLMKARTMQFHQIDETAVCRTIFIFCQRAG